MIAGIRWERVEGYLPAQAHPSSEYFPSGTVIQGLNVALNTGGALTQYIVPDTLRGGAQRPAVEELGAARLAGTFDLTGKRQDGREALGGQVSRSDRHRHAGTEPERHRLARRYAWIDLNGDLFFQKGNATWDGFKYVGGEFGALANNGTTIPNPNPFDTDCGAGPSATRLTVGVDHELLPGVRSERDVHLPARAGHATATSTSTLDQWARIVHADRRSSIRAAMASSTPRTTRRIDTCTT